MTLPCNRINFITLAVADLPRARAYFEALGWVPGFTGDAVAFYDLKGQKLSLFSREGLARETGRPAADLGSGGVTLAQNQPSEAEVDAAYAHALACGATAVRAPFRTDWGGYSCYVADPDGHLWEFAHNPFDPLDADGHLA